MKRIISCLILVSLLMLSIPACRQKEVTAPTCDEVIAAYKAAGYHVSHHPDDWEGGLYDWECYVQVWDDDIYNCVYFHFFDTPEEAEAYDATREYNILIYLFSVIYGNPQWLWTEVYGNIEYEYTTPRYMKPFKELINQIN